MTNCNWQASVFPAIPTFYGYGDSYSWSTNGVNYYPTTTSANFYPPGTSGYPPNTISNVWVKINPATCRSSGYQDLTATFNKTGSSCDPADDGGGIFYSRKAAPGSDETVEVIPNPTTSDWRLLIGNQDAQNIEATLKDAAGRDLWGKRTTNGAFDIPVIPGAGLSAGIYFLYVRVDGKQYQFKLLKQ